MNAEEADLPTSERLARVLEAEGLPDGIVAAARDYDDFRSPLAMPETQLYQDLIGHGRKDLAERVVAGEWDATKEESDAWAASFEGRQAFAELGPRMAGSVFGVDVPEGSDVEMLVAAVDVLGRSGARYFEVGYLDDNVPAYKALWWAKARYDGRVVMVEDKPGPDFAAEALARRVLDGGLCTHCRKVIRVDAPRSERHRVCRYRRVGPVWKRGCE